jgi:hypothetical protein
MAFDSTRDEDLAKLKPALGPRGADIDEDGVPLSPDAPPTIDLHLRINAWEAHWLRRMARDELSSAQRIGRLAVRDAIRRVALDNAPPRKAAG